MTQISREASAGQGNGCIPTLISEMQRGTRIYGTPAEYLTGKRLDLTYNDFQGLRRATAKELVDQFLLPALTEAAQTSRLTIFAQRVAPLLARWQTEHVPQTEERSLFDEIISRPESLRAEENDRLTTLMAYAIPLEQIMRRLANLAPQPGLSESQNHSWIDNNLTATQRMADALGKKVSYAIASADSRTSRFFANNFQAFFPDIERYLYFPNSQATQLKSDLASAIFLNANEQSEKWVPTSVAWFALGSRDIPIRRAATVQIAERIRINNDDQMQNIFEHLMAATSLDADADIIWDGFNTAVFNSHLEEEKPNQLRLFRRYTDYMSNRLIREDDFHKGFDTNVLGIRFCHMIERVLFYPGISEEDRKTLISRERAFEVAKKILSLYRYTEPEASTAESRRHMASLAESLREIYPSIALAIESEIVVAFQHLSFNLERDNYKPSNSESIARHTENNAIGMLRESLELTSDA